MINYITLRSKYKASNTGYDLIMYTCYATIQATGVVPRGHAMTSSHRQHNTITCCVTLR